MLHLENITVIKETETTKYGFLPLTLEEVEALDADNTLHYDGHLKDIEFKNLHGLFPNNLIMHGTIDDVDSNLVHNYLYQTTVKESETQPFRVSFKCFCGEKHNLDYTKTVLHGTALESWKCLIIHTGNPKYGAIINLKQHEKDI